MRFWRGPLPWAILGVALLIVLVVIGESDDGHHYKLPAPVRARSHRLATKAIDTCPAYHRNAGRMGVCAPPAQKALGRKLAGPLRGGGEQCPDLSNHNSTSNWSAIRAHGHRCGFVKISEGLGYTDPTAPGMVAAAKRAGVIVGGYVFSRVCLVSAHDEGLKFAQLVKRYRLTGRWMLDTEYGGCATASATRAWIAEEYRTVESYLRLPGGDYGGNWWFDPHAGRLFPVLDAIARFGKPIAWISGYPSANPPQGRTCIDLHQFGDHIWNGVSYGDMSRIECRITLDDLRAVPKPATPPATAHATALCHELVRIRAYVHAKGNGWPHHPKRWARAKSIKSALAKPKPVKGFPGKWIYVCKGDGSCERSAS